MLAKQTSRQAPTRTPVRSTWRKGARPETPTERFLIGDLAAAHREGWVREFWDLATGKIVHAVVIYEMQAEEEPQAIDVSRRSVGA